MLFHSLEFLAARKLYHQPNRPSLLKILALSPPESLPWGMIRSIVATCVLASGLYAAFAAQSSEFKSHDSEAIARAMSSDQKVADRAKADPNRPAYHIVAPANWINDPNGPIFHNG